MSLQATVWALKQAPVRDPYAHLVLIGLADHAGDDGRNARPSRTTLSRYARCSTRTVQTKLQELEADGVIRRGDQQQTAHLRGDRRPVVYDLVMTMTLDTAQQEKDDVQDMHPVTPAAPAPNDVQQFHPVDPHDVQQVHPVPPTTGGNGVQDVHPVGPRGERDDMNGVKRSSHRTVPRTSLLSSSYVGDKEAPVHPEGNMWRPSDNAMRTARQGAPDVSLEIVIAKYRVWCAKKKKQCESSDWVTWVLRDQEAFNKERILEREREQKPTTWYDVAD